MTMSKTTSTKTPVLMGDVNINLDDQAARRAVANMSTRGQQSFARAMQAEGMRSATTGSLAACGPSRVSGLQAPSARQPVSFGPGVAESVSMGSSRSTGVTLTGPSRSTGLALAVPARVPSPAAAPTVSTIARAVAPVVADEMERRNAQRDQSSGSGGRSGSVHVHHHNHYHRRRTRYVAPVVAAAPVFVEPAVYVPPPVRRGGWGYSYCC